MNQPQPNRVGGIVLCGGQSTRMGRDKLSLPFGPETMLQRVVRILGEVVPTIVVVAARQQNVPELPADVRLIRDEQENLGPLGGLAAGLKALAPECDAAYATACDVPFLQPQFVQFMIDALSDHELAIPREEKYYHPLAAVYRVDLQDRVRALIAQQRLRPFYLIEESRTRVVDVAELRSVDPHLNSLQNTNHPNDYLHALKSAGFTPPDNWNFEQSSSL